MNQSNKKRSTSPQARTEFVRGRSRAEQERQRQRAIAAGVGSSTRTAFPREIISNIVSYLPDEPFDTTRMNIEEALTGIHPIRGLDPEVQKILYKDVINQRYYELLKDINFFVQDNRIVKRLDLINPINFFLSEDNKIEEMLELIKMGANPYMTFYNRDLLNILIKNKKYRYIKELLTIDKQLANRKSKSGSVPIEELWMEYNDYFILGKIADFNNILNLLKKNK